MADTLTASLKVSLDWQRKAANGLSTVNDIAKIELLKALGDFASGIGSGAIDELFYATRSIAAGGNDDLDLANLSTALWGSTITAVFAKVRGLVIINKNATLDLLVGGAATNEWFAPFAASGDKVRCPALSPIVLGNRVTGYVVDATHKVLRINNAGGTAVEYDIGVIGVGG